MGEFHLRNIFTAGAPHNEMRNSCCHSQLNATNPVVDKQGGDMLYSTNCKATDPHYRDDSYNKIALEKPLQLCWPASTTTVVTFWIMGSRFENRLLIVDVCRVGCQS